MLAQLLEENGEKKKKKKENELREWLASWKRMNLCRALVLRNSERDPGFLCVYPLW